MSTGPFEMAPDGRWLLTSEDIGDLQASEFEIGFRSGRVQGRRDISRKVRQVLGLIQHADCTQSGGYGRASRDAVHAIDNALRGEGV